MEKLCTLTFVCLFIMNTKVTEGLRNFHTFFTLANSSGQERGITKDVQYILAGGH